MNKTLTDVTKTISSAVSKHTPELLTGLGIVGMISSTVLAVKATPKALKMINAKKEELKKDKLTVSETIQATWKCYVPTVATAGVSVACLIGSSSIAGKRNAAIFTAYKLAETAHKEYKDKVVEVIGEKKEGQIQEKIALDKIEKTPYNNQAVILTNNGNTLFLDYLSGQYFRSDIGQIDKAINDLNRRMYTDTYVSLNEYYSKLGLEPSQIGDDIGWNIDRGYIDIRKTPGMSPNSEPCIVISHNVEPRYGFSSIL